MAKETKEQVWTNVQNKVNELLETSKVSKTFKEELFKTLEAILAPKAGGGLAINPPRVNEDGETEYYCRFHQRYEVESDMVISAGKSKGYCKSSISLWNKTNSDIKKLDSKAVEFMSAGDFESAQSIAQESKELKDSFNNPDFYDYDRDWLAFRA